MKLKKGVRIFVGIVSTLIAVKMLQANVNLTIMGKAFYSILIFLSCNVLANIKY